MERKVLKGTDGFGHEREYDLPIISTLEGLTVFHTYSSLCVNVIPQITALFAAWAEQEQADVDSGEGNPDDRLIRMAAGEVFAPTGGGPILDIIKILPMIINTERLVALCKIFLAGAKINGKECDEDGMCDVFKGRPLEVYAALFHAIIANYPDYLPFLGAPGDTTDTESAE